MKKRLSCSRLWEAEAIEDGRLSGTERSSFEHHARTCDDCAREVDELTRLRDALERLPVATASTLERHRLRRTVIQRADAARLRVPGRLAFRVVPALALAAALLVAVVHFWPGRNLPVEAGGAPAPIVDVEPSAGAEWRTEEHGSTVRQRVVRGRVSFHVEKLDARQRFLLGLPDGELEVKGTRFVVDVGEAGTSEVSCSEGRVVLRLADHPEIVLSAGESWRKADVAVTIEAETPRASATTPSSAPVVSKKASPPKRVEIDAPSPGADFVEAMSAFSEGDLGRAERLFLAFEKRHANDARVEDAAFLRALARARRGDRDGARELAREYLQRYPKGLRKIEAEQLAR